MKKKKKFSIERKRKKEREKISKIQKFKKFFLKNFYPY